MRSKLLLKSVAIFLFLSATLAAQTPAFDSASVRAADPGGGPFSFKTDPGGVMAQNYRLDQCIAWAYSVPLFRLSGPDWLPNARFDIVAHTASPADDGQLRLMMQALLAARFGLRAHHETKDTVDYAIVVANGGPKFHAPSAHDGSQFQPSTPTEDGGFTRQGTTLIAKNISLSDLGEQLSQPLARPVVDRTGLDGRYDIRLDVSGYTATPGDSSNKPQLDDKPQLDPISIIFSAFPQQLGLRLVSGKDPIDFLVIDSLNRTPTGN